MINLLTSPWLQVRMKDGSVKKIAPFELTQDYQHNPVMDLDLPRPDFQGAMYQFLIGLLQTTCTPEENSDWKKYWDEPPSDMALKERFKPYFQVFEFNEQTPSFMQDYEALETKAKSVAFLLIDSPGEKTIKQNKDFFIKRGRITKLCPHCAAQALFTLQINGPSGGKGHRTGIRGGGPLTTLMMPDPENRSTLWEKLWLNILTKTFLEDDWDEDEYKTLDPEELSAIFPWLKPTCISDQSKSIRPLDVHPLQMYWAMPRRIRFDFKRLVSGECDLCAEKSDKLLTHYRTKKHGIDYKGYFVHPLSPYKFDEKQQNLPLPYHPQPGGIQYRYWLEVALGESASHRKTALVVDHYFRKLSRILNAKANFAQIYAFGYDMANMKARCFYEVYFPFYTLNEDVVEPFVKYVDQLIQAANDVRIRLLNAIKRAFFERPKDAKGDFSFISIDFWQATERPFFQSVKQLARLLKQYQQKEDETGEIEKVCKTWHQQLKDMANTLFDQKVLAEKLDVNNIHRIVIAKDQLRFLNKSLEKFSFFKGDCDDTASRILAGL